MSASSSSSRFARIKPPKLTGTNRVYVPQGVLAMVAAGPKSSRLYLATSGLATCVGVFVHAAPGIAMGLHLDQDAVPPDTEAVCLFPAICEWFALFSDVTANNWKCCIRYTVKEKPTLAQVRGVMAAMKTAGIAEGAIDAQHVPANDWSIELATGTCMWYNKDPGYGVADANSTDPSKVAQRIDAASKTMSGLSRGSMGMYRNISNPGYKLISAG
jgi:hypothetical protein